MSNSPCHGCWWIEGGRCFQDKLAYVHGLEKAPRHGATRLPVVGLDITENHLIACVDNGFGKSYAGVINRAISDLEKTGAKVERVSLNLVR